MEMYGIGVSVCTMVRMGGWMGMEMYGSDWSVCMHRDACGWMGMDVASLCALYAFLNVSELHCSRKRPAVDSGSAEPGDGSAKRHRPHDDDVIML